MVRFEILSRRKKEIMAEVHRLGEEEGFHHFYWKLRDPDAACKECKRRQGRLVNEYDIKYTLDTEYCLAEGDEICAFDLDPIKPRTIYEERERLLARFAELEAEGAAGVRWRTADVEGLADRCIKRHGKAFTLEAARAELSDDFCRFADPERGCECTFEPLAASELPTEPVARTPAVTPGAAPVVESKKSGCGAGVLFFAALPFAALWIALGS